MRRTSVAVAVLTLLATSSWGFAQSGSSNRPNLKAPPAKRVAPTPTPPPPPVPTAAEMSDKTARLPGIGLTVPVPAGCDAVSDSIGGAAAVTIAPQDDSTWQITIRSSIVEDPEMTVTKFADTAFTALSNKLGYVAPVDKHEWVDKRVWKEKLKASELLLVDRVPNAKDPRERRIGSGENAKVYEQWYAVHPQPANQPDALRGFAVAQLRDQNFVVYELFAQKADYEKLRPIFDVMIAGSRFLPPGEAEIQRGTAVEAGKRVFQSFGDEAYRQLIASRAERWFRLYKPGINGDDAEVGYMRFSAKNGQRGDIDPDRPKTSWGVADRQDGYVLNIDMRILQEGRVIDSRGGYFMTTDRQHEFWNVKTGIKAAVGEKPLISTELGARDELSMSVSIKATGAEDRTVKPILQSDAYVSRVDSFLLPQILVRSRVATEFGFYTWQSQAERVRYRSDVLEPNAEQPGTWKLTTRFADEATSQVSIYNENGDLIRTTMPEGVVWEPITFEKLLKLWTDKKLPLD